MNDTAQNNNQIQIKKEPTPSKYVLLAFVFDDLVNLGLFSLAGSEVKLHSWSKAQEWNGKDKDSLLHAFASSWSLLPELGKQESLPVVFLISPFWVDSEEKLVKNKKELLGHICREYRLKPLGFLLPDDSLVRFYQSDEGGASSFIGIYCGTKNMEISLVHLGKVKSRIKIEKGKGDQIAKQIEEALNRIDFQGMFPPNIVLWSDEWSQKTMDYINEFQWLGKKDSLFLHLPQITFLQWQEFFSYFKDLVQDRFPLVQNSDQALKESSKDLLLSQEAESKEQEDLDLQDRPDSNIEQSASNVIDRAAISSTEPIDLPEGFSYEDQSLQDNLDIGQDSGPDINSQENIPLNPSFDSVNIPLVNKDIEFSKKIKFPKIKIKFPSYKLKIFPILLVLICGIVAIPVAASNLVKNIVTVYVTPETVSETIDLVMKTSIDGPNIKNGIFPLEKIEANTETNGTRQVTGEKTIGEKAVGTVTVFNRTNEDVQFPSGTKLISEEEAKLEFFLRESITVGAKTADLDSGVDRLGEAQVEVIAGDIGPDYNLSKNSLFEVEGESENDYIARAHDDITGGSNRKVSAVSPDDIANLRSLLEEELKQKASEELDKKIGPGMKLVDNDPVIVVKDFSTNRREDEEAQELTGTISGSAYVLAYNEVRLEEAALSYIREIAGDDLSLISDTVNISFDKKSEEEDEVQGELVVEAKLFPTINLEEISNKLVKSNKNQVNKIIREYPRIYRFEVKTSPSLFNFWPWLSGKENNILVDLKES